MLATTHIYHTKWGYQVRRADGISFSLDASIRGPDREGSHRSYVAQFVDGEVQETNGYSDDYLGVANTLLPRVVAQVCAKIIQTGDHIPLDIPEALDEIRKIWDARIQRTHGTERTTLQAQREELIAQITEAQKKGAHIVTSVSGILGICTKLEKLNQ